MNKIRCSKTLLLAAGTALIALAILPVNSKSAPLTYDNTTDHTQADGSLINLVTSDSDAGIRITNGGNLVLTGTGENSRGINAEINNASSTEDILIGVADGGTNTPLTGNIAVAGPNARGINAVHTGTGITTINSAANITMNGASSNAINVTGGGPIVINISGGTLTATNSGIYTSASGAGAISITNAAGATITSGGHAIEAINSGTGSVQVTNAGSIETTGGGVGIQTESKGGTSIENSGTITTASSQGVFARNSTTGDLTVTNTAGATITSGGHGIEAINSGSGSVQVTNASSIGTTGGAGIQTDSRGGTSIENSGSITTANSQGVFARNSTTGDLTVTNAAGATITSGGHGIEAINSSTGSVQVTNANSIKTTGGGVGIQTDSQGGTSIENSGSITTANSQGVFAKNSNTGNLTVTNTTGATITSGGHGIEAINSSAGLIEITNATGATITSGGHGIEANSSSNGSFKLTNAGSIETTGGGVGIQSQSQGGTSIENSGTITTVSSQGVFARNSNTGDLTVTNAAGATITTGNHGIEAINSGTGNLEITNAAGASIISGGHGIETNNSGTGTFSVTNDGSIETTGGGVGIHAQSQGDVSITNSNASNITTGGGHGIQVTGTGTSNVAITNDGTIGTGGSGTGIYSEANSGNITINNNNSSQITASGNGIEANNSAGGSSGDIVINNLGKITTTAGVGIQASNAGTGNITIANNGTINAAGNEKAGIYSRATTGTTSLNNSGSIQSGTNDDAIALQSESGKIQVTNSGNLLADDSAIYASSVNNGATGGDIRIANSGSLTVSSVAGSGGIIEAQSGTGRLDIVNQGGNLTNAGIDAADTGGIFATSTTGDIAVTSTNATIAGAGAGIDATSTQGGNIHIGQTADFDGGGSFQGTYTTAAVSGVITTTGDNSHGINASTTTGAVTVNAIADITVTGYSAQGISATASGGGDIVVNFATGTINATGTNGDGINANIGGGSGNIIVNASGDINALGAGTDTQAIGAVHSGTGDITITYSGTALTVGNDGSGSAAATEGGSAINAEHNGQTGDIIIKVTDPGSVITTLGDNQVRGIRAYSTSATSAVNISIGTHTEAIQGAISTTGTSSHGIHGYTTGGSGDIAIYNNATISTTDWGAHGIVATTGGENNNSAAGSSNVTINNTGTISTAYNDAYGIHVDTHGGSGNITINNAATGVITTAGEWHAHGIYATTDGGSGAITITNAGQITTSSYESHGIYAETGNATVGSATIVNQGNITTSGDRAFAVNISSDGTADTSTYTPVLGTTSTLATTGWSAHGIYVAGTGARFVSPTETTEITTAGDDAFGLLADNNGNITLENGSITTQGTEASALHASDGGIINVTDFDIKTTSAAAIEVTNVNNTASGAITVTKNGKGSLDTGDHSLVLMSGNGTVVLTNLETSVVNGGYLLQALNDGTVSNTVTLSLDNTTVTGDIEAGVRDTEGEFIADSSLWSSTTATGKSTLNIKLTNNASLNLIRTTDDAYTFTHGTTADASSSLAISLADSAGTFAMTTPNAIIIDSGAADVMETGFTGTFILGKGSFDLEALSAGSQGSTNARALLSTSKLRMDSGSVVTITGLVNDGTLTEVGYYAADKSKAENVGGAAFQELEINGGTLVFDTLIPGTLTSENFLAVETITAGAGAIRVDMGWTTPMEATPPPAANMVALLDQQKVDGEFNYVQLASADTVTSGVGSVELLNIDGTAVEPNNIPTGTLIAQDGEVVATGDYGYALASTVDNINHDGIYVGYRLTTLHILDGKTLLIDNAGATNTVLDTLILADSGEGTGILAIADTTGNGITVNNSDNQIAAIIIADGTITVGYDQGLGTTGNLIVSGPATLDANGYTQTVGGLETKYGSEIKFNDGTLHVSGDALIGNTIVIDETSNLTVEGTTVIDAGTTAGQSGELHIKDDSGLNLNNVIVGNSDGSNGGGVIYVHDGVHLDFAGTTIVNKDGRIEFVLDAQNPGDNGGDVNISGDITVDGGKIASGKGGDGGNGGNVNIDGTDGEQLVVKESGIITGGNGGGNTTGNGGNGGHVTIEIETILDSSLITGGNGGDTTNGNGGNGGDVTLNLGTGIEINDGATIIGGNGGNTTTGNGGNGGNVNISDSTDVIIDNGGTLAGGNAGDTATGIGGNGGNIINDGQITLNPGSAIDAGQGGNGSLGNGSDGQIINNGLIVINDPVLDPQSAQTIATITGSDIYNNGAILFPENNFSGRTNGTEATLNITGNYHGGDINGSDKGQLVLNAWELGETRNVIDQVNIDGNADGHTDVTILKHAGNGGTTTGEGILVISVGGISSADAFTLANEVTAGFYSYGLFHGDTNSNWYLRSAGVNSTGGAVLTGAAGSSIGWFAQNDSLLKRMGDIRRSDGAAANGTFWTRAYGQQNNISLGSDIPDTRLYTYGADVGSDIVFVQDDSLLATGAFVGYSGNRNDVRDSNGSKSKSNGLQAGVYATWMHNNGLYADFVAKGQYADNKFDSYGASSDSGSYDSYGAGASLELGWQFESDKGWFVDPNAQVAYMHQFNDSYSTENGLRIQMQDADICQFSGMVRFGRTINVGEDLVQPYAKFGIVQQTTSGGHVRAMDGRWRPTVDGTSAVFGAGINFQVNIDTQIHLDYEGSFGEKNDKPWGINLGVTTRF